VSLKVSVALARPKKEPLRERLKEIYREASNRVGKSHSRPSLDMGINALKG
jgi:hypothetical protein